jgi:hypothetical protein
MVTWQEFSDDAPDLAREVGERFAAHKHKTMATLRADGSPRICGTEAEIIAGRLWLGGMIGNRRFADLRRDPRVALHSGSDEPAAWSGDARVSGVAVEVTDPAGYELYRTGVGQASDDGPFELFTIDLTEAVGVRLDDARESLVISSWRPGQPVTVVTRR